MGHGGYLPTSLASLVFRTGCLAENSNLPESDDSRCQWTLYHLLHYGCTCVRLNTTHSEDQDAPLLRFLFTMFQMTGDADIDEVDRSILTREQVARMLILLNEYLDFRRKVDAPVSLDDSFQVDDCTIEVMADIEESLVDVEAAATLGILPPGHALHGGEQKESARLKDVVNFFMKDCRVVDQMSFDEFCS
jgi:hypothetical protein